MPFNSLTFYCFLPVTLTVFHLSASRHRWLVLLLASVVFYATLEVPYLLGALGLVTLCTWWTGLRLGSAVSERARWGVLWGGITANVTVLVALRYLPFLADNLNALAAWFGATGYLPVPKVLVAIGVSYYVFQAIAYLSDIYLGLVSPEPHPGRFALSLAFFPKLLQGPIERAADLLPQLREMAPCDPDNLRAGMQLFLWGLFKKAVLADRLALYVNLAYDNVHGYTGLPLLVATYGFALQLYFDFSGYTDMALGVARLFNIRLTQNFERPYLATSVADFWRRWHISFSRWILDYIFKPLQMQWRTWRQGGTALALLVTFLVSGVWHGASWNFIIWGMLHGCFLVASVYYRPQQQKLHKLLGLDRTWLLRIWQRLVTFHLICLGWIFFRSANSADAWYVLTNLGNSSSGLRPYLFAHGDTELFSLVATLLIYLLVAAWRGNPGLVERFGRWPTTCRWALYYVALIGIMLMQVDSDRPFIYLQF